MDPQDGAEDSHAVDIIASLAQELKQKLDNTSFSEAVHGGNSLTCPIIIGKVGGNTRNVDPGEYVPHHVSIGPYHRATHLSRDDEKIRSFRSVKSPSVTVEQYLEKLEEIREHATRCYQDRHLAGISNGDFLHMMLVEACYLLNLFGDLDQYAGGQWRNNQPMVEGVEANGHVQGGNQSSSGSVVSALAACSTAAETNVEVVRDVFYLAENQLSFFVIESVHRLSKLEDNDSASSAAVVISRYVQELMRRLQYSEAEPDVATPPGPGNLLHLVHMYLNPNGPRSCSGGAAANSNKPMVRWRSATEYYNLAGVKFKKQTLHRDGLCQSILDVRLIDGGSTLEIPCLNIDGNTWALLRNLIALEQQNLGTTGSDVTSYCSFMSQLAGKPGDVELLARRGIISHMCGNHDDVAGYFSDLVKGVVDRNQDDENNYLRGTWQALEKRFQSRRVRWMAWLRHKYFTNPWLTVGLAAAGVALACAVVQAVYSVLSYKH